MDQPLHGKNQIRISCRRSGSNFPLREGTTLYPLGRYGIQDSTQSTTFEVRIGFASFGLLEHQSWNLPEKAEKKNGKRNTEILTETQMDSPRMGKISSPQPVFEI